MLLQPCSNLQKFYYECKFLLFFFLERNHTVNIQTGTRGIMRDGRNQQIIEGNRLWKILCLQRHHHEAVKLLDPFPLKQLNYSLVFSDWPPLFFSFNINFFLYKRFHTFNQKIVSINFNSFLLDLRTRGIEYSVPILLSKCCRVKTVPT